MNKIQKLKYFRLKKNKNYYVTPFIVSYFYIFYKFKNKMNN